MLPYDNLGRVLPYTYYVYSGRYADFGIFVDRRSGYLLAGQVIYIYRSLSGALYADSAEITSAIKER